MAAELIGLGVLFLCAIVGGIIAARFKQPPVFGLLLVGAIIGPSSLNLVQDLDMINMMADLGAILLLFAIGLEFDVSKLMKLGARSILIGFLKFAIVLFLGYETTLLLGFSSKVALFVGVILSFSSTVVIIKVLEQKEMFKRKEVPLLVAILIIEDILAVFALTFFSGIKDSGSSFLSTLEHIIFSIAILVFAYLITMKILKYAVNIILKNSSDESVLIFLSLGIGSLFSYFAYTLGLAPSAGAFLAGSLIASLPNAKDYGRAIHPYTIIFTSIFFMAMGTLIDFQSANEHLPLIAILLVVVIVARFIGIGLTTSLLANFKSEQPVFASIAMMSIGEFSLLVAKESQKFDIGVDLVTVTAAIIFISAILMSISINYSESLHNLFSSRAPISTRLRLERVSDYMRRFFDQMEIENFSTKKLGAESKMAFMLAILTLFTFFILRRLSLIIQENYNAAFLYIFYALSSMLIIYLASLIFKKLKSMHGAVSFILTNVDSSRNLKKCRRILNSMLLAMFLFFSAMLFPFAMFALNLNAWANIIPFILIIGALYFVKGSFMLIEGGSHPAGFASFSAAKF
ncbi:cation:proton antiporter [Candidatus Woesearchaeota archaeon]|nr:cation:proton antiporter [Candidatus Woesearchaeota archaeon]